MVGKLLKAMAGVALIISAAVGAQEEGSLTIHIDQECRIVTQDPPGSAKLTFQKDRYTCHLESRHDSEHWEENTVNGQPKRTLVKVHEQEYLLHDTMDVPVTFVVTMVVPNGWYIDSDPQPTAMEESTAIFRVDAQPGQTVRLHVGVRN